MDGTIKITFNTRTVDPLGALKIDYPEDALVHDPQVIETCIYGPKLGPICTITEWASMMSRLADLKPRIFSRGVHSSNGFNRRWNQDVTIEFTGQPQEYDF